MARTIPEWRGATDDAAIPPRVRLRIFRRYAGHCANCTREVGLGLSYAFDHVIALVNGGTHCESNLQLLCDPCHRDKTKADVAVKSKTNAVSGKHFGLKKSRTPLPCGRSSPWKKKIGGQVVRR